MLENGGELALNFGQILNISVSKWKLLVLRAQVKIMQSSPVMLGDAKVASLMADKLLAEGIYVTRFSFPVVPKGQARIRTQISAAHSIEQLDTAIDAFTRIGKEMGVI